MGCALLGAAVLFGVPSSARAHPVIDEAKAAYHQAEFEVAIRLLADAEGGDDLSRAEAVELLLWRSIVHYALGDEAAWVADVQRLARAAPELALGPELPPRFRERFRAFVDEGLVLALDTRVRRTEDVLEVSAVVVGDPGGLVRSIRVAGRLPGASTRWERARGATLRIAEPDATSVEYYVEVVGPGGAVLVREGSAESPARADVRLPALGDGLPAHTIAAHPGSTGAMDREASTPWGWWLALGAGVAVAAGVVVAVLVLTARTETAFGPPEVR
jgi:hypothetical protein